MYMTIIQYYWATRIGLPMLMAAGVSAYGAYVFRKKENTKPYAPLFEIMGHAEIMSLVLFLGLYTAELISWDHWYSVTLTVIISLFFAQILLDNIRDLSKTEGPNGKERPVIILKSAGFLIISILYAVLLFAEQIIMMF